MMFISVDILWSYIRIFILFNKVFIILFQINKLAILVHNFFQAPISIK